MATRLLLHLYRIGLLFYLFLATSGLRTVEPLQAQYVSVCRCRGGAGKRPLAQDDGIAQTPKKAALTRWKFADHHGEEYQNVKYRGVSKSKDGFLAKSLRKTIGVYSTAKIAALAYDMSALVNHRASPGSRFPTLNFEDSPVFFQHEVDNGRDPVARVYSIAGDMLSAGTQDAKAHGFHQQYVEMHEPITMQEERSYRENEVLTSQDSQTEIETVNPEKLVLMEKKSEATLSTSTVRQLKMQSKAIDQMPDTDLGWRIKPDKPKKIANVNLIRVREKPQNNCILLRLNEDNTSKITRRVWKRYGSSMKSLNHVDKQMIYISKRTMDFCPYCPGPVVHDDGTNSYGNPLHCSYELDHRMTAAAYLREGVERGYDLGKWKEVEAVVLRWCLDCELCAD